MKQKRRLLSPLLAKLMKFISSTTKEIFVKAFLEQLLGKTQAPSRDKNVFRMKTRVFYRVSTGNISRFMPTPRVQHTSNDSLSYYIYLYTFFIYISVSAVCSGNRHVLPKPEKKQYIVHLNT